MSPFAIAASGQLADSHLNVIHRTFFAPSRIDFVFLSPVVSFAFRPLSFPDLVDSSCIYNPYIIVVLVVHWNKRGYIAFLITWRRQILPSDFSPLTRQIMSARQPFRPTPRPGSQFPSSQLDSLKTSHPQRIDADLSDATNGSFNFSGLFNPKKRDQPLPIGKSKSREDHQVSAQNISNSSWSAGSHTPKLDPSCAPSPVLSSTTSGLGNASTYQSSGIPSTQVEDIPSSPIVDDGGATSSFFGQEANSQHLLPMINEIDEDTELVHAPTTSSASLFFTGRYADDSGSRKRAQRTEDDLDAMGNVDTKRIKSEQVGSQTLPSMRRFVTMMSRPGVRFRKQITPTLVCACCAAGTIQDETV